jgi:hypothetical protein
LAGGPIPQFVSLLSYPLLYGASAGVDESNGYAGYNSLQARVSHSFSSGLHFMANFTWGKDLDYTSTAIEDGQGVNSGGTIASPDLLNTTIIRDMG